MPSTRSELTVTVKLFATLRAVAPQGANPNGFPMAVPSGSTVRDLADRLGIPAADWKATFRNHVRCAHAEALQEGDVIAFVPPIAGG
jgi:molybdopterin converting factor small subunit